MSGDIGFGRTLEYIVCLPESIERRRSMNTKDFDHEDERLRMRNKEKGDEWKLDFVDGNHANR